MLMGFIRENLVAVVFGGLCLVIIALFNACVARSFDVYADLLRSLKND